jgi:hypothetical protein
MADTPVQNILIDTIIKTIPEYLALIDLGIGSGRNVDLACRVASDDRTKLLTHGIVAEIDSEADFRAGRYTSTQQRNIWGCNVSMRLYLPQDLPDQEQYLQDLRWLEGQGVTVPQPLATMQDAAAAAMVAIRKLSEVQDITPMPPIPRNVSNGQTRLAMRVFKVKFVPCAPLDAISSP